MDGGASPIGSKFKGHLSGYMSERLKCEDKIWKKDVENVGG